MTEWYQKAYPGGAAVTTIQLPRPVYPPDAKGYTPSEPGDDITAYKRIISRGGRWPWQTFDNQFSNSFSHGKSGNVSESGVAGYQRQMNIGDSGYIGTTTFNSMRNARIPAGLPNAGQPLMDKTAIDLLQKAWNKYKGNAEPPSSAPTSPLSRKQIPSPNYSSRSGATVRLIVLHTAEGARTIEELGNFFGSSSSQVSSHTGIDDKDGVIGEYVKRDYKAWTAAGANPVAVQVELCAFASWSAAEWDKHPNMLKNCARWIAEEAKKYGIPITKLSASSAQGSGRGVCQHVDLGSWGGGHHDCGSSFPIDKVLSMAKGY